MDRNKADVGRRRVGFEDTFKSGASIWIERYQSNSIPTSTPSDGGVKGAFIVIKGEILRMPNLNVPPSDPSLIPGQVALYVEAYVSGRKGMPKALAVEPEAKTACFEDVPVTRHPTELVCLDGLEALSHNSVLPSEVAIGGERWTRVTGLPNTDPDVRR